MAKIPDIEIKHKVCIICEGFEDKAYINRLKELHVWNQIYDFSPKNALCASNIPALFQDIYQNDSYEIVLVFCDTDRYPYKEYVPIKEKINKFFDKPKAAEKLIIFANPCTMQIILSHFGNVALKNQGKKTNASLIEEFTGVKNYDAHEDQIKEICNKIFKRTYDEMKQRVEKINFPDTVSCSTNFCSFLENFEKDDTKWITVIKGYLRK